MVIEHAPLLIMIGIIVSGYAMWMGTGIVIMAVNIRQVREELQVMTGGDE